MLDPAFERVATELDQARIETDPFRTQTMCSGEMLGFENIPRLSEMRACVMCCTAASSRPNTVKVKVRVARKLNACV